MAKVLATEVRAGNLIEWDKRVWRVLKSYHVHVGGRGGAFMQVEMKDIESGTKRNERIRTEDKIERAYVEPRAMQYLYNDGTGYVFMDQQTFEQLALPQELLEGQAGYDGGRIKHWCRITPFFEARQRNGKSSGNRHPPRQPDRVGKARLARAQVPSRPRRRSRWRLHAGRDEGHRIWHQAQ